MSGNSSPRSDPRFAPWRLAPLALVLLTLACAVPGRAQRFALDFEVPQPQGFSALAGRLEVVPGNHAGRRVGRGRQYEGVVEKVDLRIEENGKSVLFASSEPMASSLVLTPGRDGDRVIVEVQLAYLTLSGMQMQKVRLELVLAPGRLRGVVLGELPAALKGGAEGVEVRVEATVSNTQAPRRPRRGEGGGRLTSRRL